MKTTATDNLRDKLKRIEAELGEARDERVALTKARDDARERFARARDVTPRSREYREAEAATKALAEHDAHIEDLRAVQLATLRMLGRDQPGGGDRNGPRSTDIGAGRGFQAMAAGIDVRRGQYTMDTSIEDLLGRRGGLRGRRGAPLAAGFITPSEGLSAPSYEVPGIVEKLRDVRFLYPHLPSQPTDPGDMALAEYRQVGTRSVEGSIERDPVSTAAKPGSTVRVG